jgi:hypothetical protein
MDRGRSAVGLRKGISRHSRSSLAVRHSKPPRRRGTHRSTSGCVPVTTTATGSSRPSWRSTFGTTRPRCPEVGERRRPRSTPVASVRGPDDAGLLQEGGGFGGTPEESWGLTDTPKCRGGQAFRRKATCHRGLAKPHCKGSSPVLLASNCREVTELFRSRFSIVSRRSWGRRGGNTRRRPKASTTSITLRFQSLRLQVRHWPSVSIGSNCCLSAPTPAKWDAPVGFWSSVQEPIPGWRARIHDCNRLAGSDREVARSETGRLPTDANVLHRAAAN